MKRTLARIFATLGAASLLAVAPALPAQTNNVCTTCGVVQSVRFVEEQGKGSGVGLVAGAVVGGVLGHQIGSGRGNTVATVAGAAGGAYAGNAIEKNQKKKSHYEVTVRLDSGKTRTLTYSNAPVAREGERVKILSDNRLALLAK
jgi:outer membrane lipoprotein SlyB